MAKQYRVVDCRTKLIEPGEVIVVADTPEHAARLAIGEDLIRGSRQVNSLRARVYYSDKTALTMVRLYSKPVAEEAPIRRNPPSE